MTPLKNEVLATNAVTIWLARLGLALCIGVSVFWLSSQYATLSTLNPYYRINTSALCLLFGFVLACFSMRFAIMGCVFALPLLPTFAWQFQLYTGYGRIQDTASPGLDLVVGIMLGLIANALASKPRLRDRFALPWTAALVMLVLTVSVAMAIARNLHQSASPFTLQALLYNLVNMRSLGWHDDYRPLVDWASYGIAFLLLAMFVPALKNMPDRNEVVFKPLIAGLVIAALVGWRQSTTGAGLSHNQLYFRPDGFGYMALGFQPDLHAFAGHMLLGALGLLGYLYYKKSTWLRLLLLGAVMPLCWLMLFLSKSKATFALAVLGLFIIGAIWIFRHTKYIKHVVLAVFVCVMMVVLSILPFIDNWATLLTFTLNKFNLPDLNAINLKLSYRPEVYLAALRMFALFPFAGFGQGEFYRQSANYDLTHSFFLSVDQNGENAHNYFLQTLAETGILGFGAFLLLLAYPLIRTTNKRVLIPALIAVAAAFVGNLFAHSMLVRENLLLAACFVALLYTFIPTQETTAIAYKRLAGFRQPKILLPGLIVTLLFIAKETYQSFKSFPFNVDMQCQEARRTDRDGWTSGRHVLDVPVGALGMILNLATTQPDVVTRPLPASLAIWFDRGLLLKRDFVLNQTAPQTLTIDLPEGRVATPDDYQIELNLQRCFIPKNFGINSDGRRLGVRIDSIDWRY
jgi:O-antigen ligase